MGPLSHSRECLTMRLDLGLGDVLPDQFSSRQQEQPDYCSWCTDKSHRLINKHIDSEGNHLANLCFQPLPESWKYLFLYADMEGSD